MNQFMITENNLNECINNQPTLPDSDARSRLSNDRKQTRNRDDESYLPSYQIHIFVVDISSSRFLYHKLSVIGAHSEVMV